MMKKVILCPNPYRDKGLEAAREALRTITFKGKPLLPREE